MMSPNFTPFPELRTKRLLLRAVTPEDATELLFLRSDPDVMQYIDRPAAGDIHEVTRFIEMIGKDLAANDGVLWGIVPNEQEKIIGTVCFWRLEKENYRGEIGYALHPDWQHKGLMQEAIEQVLEYGFKKMGLHSVVANINPENAASRELLRKLGFTREAYFRENYYFNGQFLDSEIYVRLMTD